MIQEILLAWSQCPVQIGSAEMQWSELVITLTPFQASGGITSPQVGQSNGRSAVGPVLPELNSG